MADFGGFLSQLTTFALPLILRRAHDPNRLRKELVPQGFKVVDRRLRDGTRQWRFSHLDSPGDEIILAKFRPGVGFPVHRHPHIEKFWFQSLGVWNQNGRKVRVRRGDCTVTSPDQRHGWQGGGSGNGRMVVLKLAPRAA